MQITSYARVFQYIVTYCDATTCPDYVQAVSCLVISFALIAHIAAEQNVRGFPDEYVVIRVMGLLGAADDGIIGYDDSIR